MAIDRQRLALFNEEMAGLLEELTFESFYQLFQDKLFDYLSGLVNGTEVPGITELRKEVGRLFDPELAKHARNIFNHFEDTVNLVNSRYADLGTNIGRDLPRLQRVEALTQSYLGRYRKSTVAQIAKVVRKGLLDGNSIRQITRALKAGTDGKAQFYARTIAQTAVKGYGRAGKAEKANLAEVFYYEYVGIIRKNTRPFCRLMVGSTHHIDFIRVMRNGNLEPVITHCGGWNCHHDWEPDPFAREGSAGEWKEREIGGRKIKIFTRADLEKEIENWAA